MYTQVNHSCCWLFKRTKERNSLFLHQGKQGNEKMSFGLWALLWGFSKGADLQYCKWATSKCRLSKNRGNYLLLSWENVSLKECRQEMNLCLWNRLGRSAPTDGTRDCEGAWQKQLLVKAREKKQQLFTPYLVFSPLRRCVALGAKGHLRGEKEREKESC